ncbi:GAF and ANTAR domain-containing protein [Jiangella gansuensis]|uniref:GAF and ANTAR domain-containing protein n=1 Tax=Jiangella gansuensis TaxID=281473 RepID=UPI0004BCA2CD|nr:GAF and ANTAR domain-containing protein [Jiangella gansuensis]
MTRPVPPTGHENRASPTAAWDLADETASLLADVAVQLHRQPGVGNALRAAVGHLVDLAGCDAATGALFARRRWRLHTSVATGAVAEEADAHQVRLREGPAFTVMRERTSVVVPDAVTDVRWPRWRALIAPAGVRAAVAVPLDLGTHLTGVVTAYWTGAGRPGPDAVEAAELLALHASIGLTVARESTTLREAIDARHRIGVAQGILMERYGLSAQQAFDVLRRYSRDNNVKLGQVAREVVETRSLPGWAAGPTNRPPSGP